MAEPDRRMQIEVHPLIAELFKLLPPPGRLVSIPKYRASEVAATVTTTAPAPAPIRRCPRDHAPRPETAMAPRSLAQAPDAVTAPPSIHG